MFFKLIILFSTIFCMGYGYKKTKEEVLSEKVKQLTDWNVKKSVIRMKVDKFRQYVRGVPRNYSAIVMLTALQPQRKCLICGHANDEFMILANSWRLSQQYSNALFFIMVDFDESQDVFRSLNINFAPAFMHFPPKGKPKKADTMNNPVYRDELSAEKIAKWVQQRTDIHIRVIRPPNYAGTFALAFLFVLVAGLFYWKRKYLKFLQNKSAWGIGTMMLLFVMTSGQMWNHIRGPPLMHINPNSGQTQYIHGSAQSQYVLETYFVMVLNAAVVIGFLLLNKANSIKQESWKKKVLAMVGLGFVAIFFSLLLSVFSSKYKEYPYSFLL